MIFAFFPHRISIFLVICFELLIARTADNRPAFWISLKGFELIASRFIETPLIRTRRGPQESAVLTVSLAEKHLNQMYNFFFVQNTKEI